MNIIKACWIMKRVDHEDTVTINSLFKEFFKKRLLNLS